MKVLFWIGVLLVALGVASLFVPIPHKERQGFSVGDLSVGVETKHSETVSPLVSVVLIAGGVGLMVAGKFAK